MLLTACSYSSLRTVTVFRFLFIANGIEKRNGKLFEDLTPDIPQKYVQNETNFHDYGHPRESRDPEKFE